MQRVKRLKTYLARKKIKKNRLPWAGSAKKQGLLNVSGTNPALTNPTPPKNEASHSGASRSCRMTA
jgi:hypothetical protein